MDHEAGIVNTGVLKARVFALSFHVTSKHAPPYLYMSSHRPFSGFFNIKILQFKLAFFWCFCLPHHSPVTYSVTHQGYHCINRTNFLRGS